MIEPAERSKTIVVAMSGGVDSSVAAALLKNEGRKVIGITMDFFGPAEDAHPTDAGRSCCGRPAGQDAGRVAAKLGIPFFLADFRLTFEQAVIEDFILEYRRGRTPNPCVQCNRFVKFGPLLQRAERLGAEGIATGHYARVGYDAPSGRWLLRKGLDPDKDQSYFLYPLSQAILSRTSFPVGELRKAEVRALAEKFDLPTAHRPESQEICFVPDDDYAAFLRTRIPEAFRPGPIVDVWGRVIGRHAGVLNFTIGQRKGLGVSAAHPLYVVAIDTAANKVVVGRSEDLYRKRLVVGDVNWVALEGLKGMTEAAVKIRYRAAEARAVLHPQEGGTVLVEFDRAQRAAAPGQAAVFFREDIVLGGGTIEHSLD
jgi:tRNA-specific 2-thiouridylase